MHAECWWCSCKVAAGARNERLLQWSWTSAASVFLFCFFFSVCLLVLGNNLKRSDHPALLTEAQIVISVIIVITSLLAVVLWCVRYRLWLLFLTLFLFPVLIFLPILTFSSLPLTPTMESKKCYNRTAVPQVIFFIYSALLVSKNCLSQTLLFPLFLLFHCCCSKSHL